MAGARPAVLGCRRSRDGRRTWLYLDSNVEHEFESTIEGKPVDSGENLMVMIPDDSGVFYRVETGSNRLPVDLGEGEQPVRVEVEFLAPAAVRGRDKPKDVYDLCYCLDEYPDAIAIVAADWRARRDDPLIIAAIEILRAKFQTVDHYGPQQLAMFHDAVDVAERAMHARRAFELAQKLLSLL